MKVICTSPSFARYDAAPIDTLRRQGFELITLPADAPLSALAPHLADTVALIVAFTEVNDALLSLAPQLKIVCKHGVGVDNIDLDATRARGIYVTNVPDANKHAVADFAFALILNSARQITTAAIETRAGHWPRIFATDVYGKTLGIIGLGNIGKQVALRAKGFNMRILAFDFYPDDAFAAEHGVTFVSLDQLTEHSDFITLHMPLTDQTQNLFDAARLKRMKKSAFLINASRGGVVNEQDLYQALQDNVIAGAAADVFVQEPLAQHPLFTLSNFIPTAHLAGYTDGAISAIGERCVTQIVQCIKQGERPMNVMNGLA
ncbi:hydroxyacid dehydrogenase [Pantoea sp. SGAir0184]|jgi:D-3-phosphoglycerate dehydrogenase / 2-oxoglutarate reductase|uniref:Hydroxyacid dehydrogenase n=1 Tax=Pantoea dispersa TaxID=59814 RepID=A0ABY3A097_9GAMM|nr:MULTISPECIES: phosphoglycerate dehydrogenase [Pantoea]NIG15023.1 phosphoglycerate dehydrogenase [Pantoea sp. Cy-640]TQC75158.1 hydroxyacid dehydrogenase [Pantoea dispersa]UKY35873.1 phosphoglycerate dehydrogenase [Pantoea dispersa]